MPGFRLLVAHPNKHLDRALSTAVMLSLFNLTSANNLYRPTRTCVYFEGYGTIFYLDDVFSSRCSGPKDDPRETFGPSHIPAVALLINSIISLTEG